MKVSYPLSQKVQLAFLSAVLTLLVVGVISYRGIIVAAESARWVQHTHEVLENLADSLSAMQNVESSDRGFVLTGQEDYLGPYRDNVARAKNVRAAVRYLTMDNLEQQSRLPTLERLAIQKVQFGDSHSSFAPNGGIGSRG
jgi:CHASE3 domain sensor protein